jgi:hypothetical protein
MRQITYIVMHSTVVRALCVSHGGCRGERAWCVACIVCVVSVHACGQHLVLCVLVGHGVGVDRRFKHPCAFFEVALDDLHALIVFVCRIYCRCRVVRGDTILWCICINAYMYMRICVVVYMVLYLVWLCVILRMYSMHHAQSSFPASTKAIPHWAKSSLSEVAGSASPSSGT